MKKHTEILYDYLVKKIDPLDVFESSIPDVEWSRSSNTNTWCPFHNPKGKLAANSPSLSVNAKTGEFLCHSCNVKGLNIVQFYQQLHNLEFRPTLTRLFKEFIHPIVPTQLVEQWHANLINTPDVLSYLIERRGLSMDVIEHSGVLLGYDGDRITLPVKNQFGFVVNVRRYDFRGTGERKMLNYREGYGCIELYPFHNVVEDSLFLVEGEFDALLLTSLGYKAVTPTGGVGAWSTPASEFNEYFKDKDVVICFDVNDPQNVGIECAKKRAGLLMSIAKSVKVLELPIAKRGGDITDYFIEEGFTPDQFDELVELTPYWSAKDVTSIDKTALHDVELGEASQGKFIDANVRSKVLIAGKEDTPVSTPSKVKFECPKEPDKRCIDCPFGELASKCEEEVDLYGEDISRILEYTTLTTNKLVNFIKGQCEFPTACKRVNVEYLEYINVERVALVPDVLKMVEDSSMNYVQRDGYYIGHGISSNKTYEITSVPVAHPRNQKTVHIITNAKASQSSHESFVMTPDIYEELSVFQTNDIEGMLTKLYDDYAYHVTGIVGRPWLHMAIDLVFFSALRFKLTPRDIVHKGWLDVFIGGDSRTGKGRIAESLIRFYQAGEIIDAGNCSKAGLIGGINQQEGRNFIVWGRLVLNDGKLLIIDELSSLDEMIIRDLSRPRSEGVADIVKINTDRAPCRTRLIMISNPRSGRPVSKFNYGVEVLKNVVDQPEDIARFDYAFITAEHDVNSRDINREQEKRPDSIYVSDAAKKLVQWVWSRKEDQVLFKKSARDLIYAEAIRLGEKYSADIPLVQASNVRHKIAKIAVAIAGRTFSCTSSGDKILVTRECVEAALNFLEQKNYDRPVMAYQQFSEGVKSEEQVGDSSKIKTIINNNLGQAPRIVGLLMKRKIFTVGDFQDYCAMDRQQAEVFKGQLLQEGCLVKIGNDKMVKTAGFQDLLKELNKEYEQKGAPKLRRTLNV